ncbi:beta-lactamase/transpeptidase-like protein [Hyaloraphidium curvatum]|nr:beta-lactamase/transpeptidase-like protein [Hyaloraphidium curvatum]
MAAFSTHPRLAAELQRLADAEAAHDGAACVLRVDVPPLDFSSRHASGGLVRAADEPAGPREGAGARAHAATTFRIASVTKTFTAAVVLQLVGEGKIKLDEPVASYLPSGILDVVDRLHVLEGVSSGRKVTIRHCLTHSSGLFDYAMSKGFGRAAWVDPQHFWTPREMLEGAIAWGKPTFAPDLQKYAYNDTGYVLLGVAIEQLDDRPLHESYRARIIDPLGLKDTYLEGHETHRGAPISHPYIGTRDALAMHGTTDWAGGGLVSTVDDLAAFVVALLGGKVVPEPLLTEMLHWRFREFDAAEMQLRAGTLGYGLGVIAREYDGMVFLGHTGYWGVVMYMHRETGVVLTATINQTERSTDGLIRGAVAAVKAALAEAGGGQGGKL